MKVNYRLRLKVQNFNGEFLEPVRGMRFPALSSMSTSNSRPHRSGFPIFAWPGTVGEVCGMAPMFEVGPGLLTHHPRVK
jgi:hypothetical protein